MQRPLTGEARPGILPALSLTRAQSHCSAVSLASAESQSDAEPALCRICYGPSEEEEAGPVGALITPCKCTGSVAHVHCRCLYSWRKAQVQAKGFGRSQQCEMCRSPYRIPPSHAKYFDRELMGGAVPGPRQCWHMVTGRFSSPAAVAELALDLWLHAVLMGGVRQGAVLGALSCGRSLSTGLALVHHNSRQLRRWQAPVRTVTNLRQLSTLTASAALLAGLSLEVIIASCVSGYLGALVGFGLGTAGMLRASWMLGGRMAGHSFSVANRAIRWLAAARMLC